MLVIRLQRIGKKHQPSYRLVVAERRSKLGAPPREDLGSYSTATKKANFDAERVNYWLRIGARPSVTAHNLLVQEKLVSAPKRKVYMAKPQAAASAAAEAPAAQAETTPAEPTA